MMNMPRPQTKAVPLTLLERNALMLRLFPGSFWLGPEFPRPIRAWWFPVIGLVLALILGVALCEAQHPPPTGNSPSNEGEKQEAGAPKPLTLQDQNRVLRSISAINRLAAEINRMQARFPEAQKEQEAEFRKLNLLTLELQKSYKAENFIFNDEGEWRPNPQAAPPKPLESQTP